MAGTPGYNSASLYVGDLHPDVTETMLFDLFKSVGQVASIRVCRDAATRRSLGYAYVNFHNATDAERALDALNYHNLRGKNIRIMWSHRDPSLRKSGAGNIFIKNLDKGIDNKGLCDVFSAFGNILSCKVATDELGQSKGYGFVHYETAEAGETAIEKVNGMQLNGKVVFVGLFKARRERDDSAGGPGEERKFTNVYVNNLHESIDEEKLKRMFAVYGAVTSCVVMTTPEGVSRGFGFVNFEKPEEAKAAVEALNNKDIEGKQMYAGRAQKKGEREAELRAKFEAVKLERIAKEAGVNLYVKNLDDQVDDEKLRAEFAQFGQITSCKVMKSEAGQSKGFGFVCFATPEEATKAVTEMNGRMIGVKPIYVALAQRKEVRRAQLESFHRAQQNMTRGFPGPMYQTPMGVPVYYPGAVPAGGLPTRGGPGGYPAGANMVPRPRWNAQGGAVPGGVPGQAGPGGVGVPRGAGGPYAGQQQLGNYVLPNMTAGGPGAAGGRQQRGPRPQGGVPPQQGMFPPQQKGGFGGQPRGGPAPQGAAAGPQVGADGRAITYDLKSGAVNAPRPGTPQMIPAALPTQFPPLNPQLLATINPEDRKQFIGESLFPLIGSVQPNHAGKITGMLLESMEIPLLLSLLENPASLQAKIDEAVQVLQQAEQQAEQQQQ